MVRTDGSGRSEKQASPEGDGPARLEAGFLSPGGGPFGLPRKPGEFDAAMRGYDRRQVDEHVAELRAQLGSVDAERARVAALEAELADVRAQLTAAQEASPASEGFGARAERLLRLAEREAEETRERATEESAEILATARRDAEKHRQQVERAVVERATKVDEDATKRTAAIMERERVLAQQVESTRREADGMLRTAERAAEDVKAAAERRSRELLAQAKKESDRERARATAEVDRLSGMRDEVRAELVALHRDLSQQLGLEGSAVPTPATGNPAPAVANDPGPRGVAPLRGSVKVQPAER